MLTFQITVEKLYTTLMAYKICNKQKIPCFKSNLPSKQVFILMHSLSVGFTFRILCIQKGTTKWYSIHCNKLRMP